MKTAFVYKLLWLRHCWWFAWAHKPLCRYFHEDVLRIGKLYLCRSCTAAYGAGLVIALALWFFKFKPTYIAVIYAIFFPIALILSWPTTYKRLPRVSRDILRAVLGAAIPITAYMFFWGSKALAMAGIGCFALFWQAANQKRHQHKMKICECCPEMSSHRACPGYQQQLISIRRFQDEAMLARMRFGEWPPQIKIKSRRVEESMLTLQNSDGHSIQQ